MLRFIMNLNFLILCPNHNAYLDYISIHLKILFLANIFLNIKPGPSIQYCFRLLSSFAQKRPSGGARQTPKLRPPP